VIVGGPREYVQSALLSTTSWLSIWLVPSAGAHPARVARAYAGRTRDAL
jgi:hypothetical protein